MTRQEAIDEAVRRAHVKWPTFLGMFSSSDIYYIPFDVMVGIMNFILSEFRIIMAAQQ